MDDDKATPRGRYRPHEQDGLVICTECSAPDNPAVIPAETTGRHDLWHDMLKQGGTK